MNLYDKVFPPKVIVLPNGNNVTKPRSRAPLAAAVLLALTVLSVKVTGFDMSLLARRIKEFFVILGQMIPPQWSYMPQIWQPLFDTIKMSLLGSVIGSLLVVPFAMLASSNIIHNGAYCHLCVRPGHAGRHHSHCRVYLRLHRQDLV